MDKVREIEKQLAANKNEMQTIELKLSDEGIYADAQRKDELTDLVRDQATVKSTIAALEWDWMEASEALEDAGQAANLS